MGNRSSRSRNTRHTRLQAVDPTKAVDHIQTCLEDVTKSLEALQPGTVSTLTFVLSSLMRFDQAVVRFIRSAKEHTRKTNFDILEAYYIATAQAKDVALTIQNHANLSISELETLAMVGDNVKHDQQERALEALKLVNIQHLNLPDSIFMQIEMAKTKYEEVIVLCNQACEELEERAEEKASRLQWASVGLIIAASAVLIISLVIPPAAAAAGTAAAVALVLDTGSFVSGVASASVLSVAGVELGKLQTLVSQLVRRQEILDDAQEQAGRIIGRLSQVQPDVERVQNDLQGLGRQATNAKNIESLTAMGQDRFLTTVARELEDLGKLRGTCDELIQCVIKAFNIFQNAKGFMVEHTLRKYECQLMETPKGEKMASIVNSNP